MTRPTVSYQDNFGQQAGFSIPEPHTAICCNLSGGADSALLAYLVIRYCQQYIPDAEIHFITCANPVKGWYNAKWANRVIETLLKNTKTQAIKSHYVFYENDQSRDLIQVVERDYARRKKATVIFNAVTQNPPLDIPELVTGRFTQRDPGGHRTPSMIRESDGAVILYNRPFVSTDKRMVAHIYREERLDWLYPNTRSCEQHLADNQDNMESHCGVCWWCRERSWAFGDLTTLNKE